MKQIALSLLLLLVGLMALGCETELGQPGDPDDSDEGPILSETESTGCKPDRAPRMRDDRPGRDGSMPPGVNPIQALVRNGVVTVIHHDAYYHCDADIVFMLQAKGNRLILTEVDRSGMVTDCMCWMDLSVDILNLTAGIYHIEVWDQYHSTMFGQVTVKLGDCPDQCRVDADCLGGVYIDLPEDAMWCPGRIGCVDGMCQWICEDYNRRCQSDYDCPNGYQCVWYGTPWDDWGNDHEPYPGQRPGSSEEGKAPRTRPDGPVNEDEAEAVAHEDYPMPYHECMTDADCPADMWCELWDYTDYDEPFGYPMGTCVGDVPPGPEQWGYCEPVYWECDTARDCERLYGSAPYDPNCAGWSCQRNQCVYDCRYDDCYSNADCPRGYRCEFYDYGWGDEPVVSPDDDGAVSEDWPGYWGGGVCVPDHHSNFCEDAGGRCFGQWEGNWGCPDGWEPLNLLGPGEPLCGGVGGICCVPVEPIACASDRDCQFPGDIPWVCVNGTCQPDYEACACPAIYAPVCGVDGKTYENACAAECVRVRVAHEGPCEDDCICPEYYAPVCGTDGVTYDNPCFAQCAGVRVAHEGRCENACDCPRLWEPVCGTDGQTYANRCQADCHNVGILHLGECQTEPDVYCMSNSDCRDGQVCTVEDGDCLTPPWCGGDVACPSVCFGLCKPAAGIPCSNDSDCPADMYCNGCPPYPGCPECDACGEPICM